MKQLLNLLQFCHGGSHIGKLCLYLRLILMSCSFQGYCLDNSQNYSLRIRSTNSKPHFVTFAFSIFLRNGPSFKQLNSFHPYTHAHPNKTPINKSFTVSLASQTYFIIDYNGLGTKTYPGPQSIVYRSLSRSGLRD